MKMRVARRVLALMLMLACVSCLDRKSHGHAVYLLIDTSGTYTQELDKARLVINYLLGTLNPGDTLAVARVKSRSFTEKDIIAKVTFVRDPLQVHAQKRAFSEQIAKYTSATKHGSAYTDITGGVLQAVEFLQETGAAKKSILIFSDMQEELDYKTLRDFPITLTGIHVVALNVTKLTTDNIDPRRYLERLAWWEKRALAAGAVDWRVVNDLEHLERVFQGK